MQISITNKGNVCKLSQTDRNRINEVLLIFAAIGRHADDSRMKQLAKVAETNTSELLLLLNAPAAAPAKA